MLILELHKDKVLRPVKTACNYTGENNFEKIRIVADKTISDMNLSELQTELYIYNIIDEDWFTFNDCVLCEFVEENGEYIFEIPIKSQYTVFPQLGMYLKFTDENGVVGKTNEVKTMILHHKDSTIDTSNSIELFERYKKKIEKASLKVPYIGEDGFWYVCRANEYVRTDFPAQGEQGEKGDKGDPGEKGADGQNGVDGQDGIGISNTKINADGELILTYTNGNSDNLGIIKGEKGDNGNDYVLTESDKYEIANIVSEICDKSNIESGTGSLTISSTSHAGFFSEMSFNYQKIGDYVIVNLHLVNAEEASSYMQFNLSGLPFVSDESKCCPYTIWKGNYVYDVQFSVRANSSNLVFAVSKLSELNQTMNPTIIYKIKE